MRSGFWQSFVWKFYNALEADFNVFIEHKLKFRLWLG